MPIKLQVGSEFSDAEARKVAREAKDYFKRQDIDVKVQAKMDDASMRKAVSEAKRHFQRQGVDLRVDIDTRETDRGLANLIHRLNDLGRATAFTARGLGTLALPVTGLVLIDIAKAAVTATQSIALLPAVLTSAATAFGTLKLATLGFGDAMEEIGDPEKFAEALQSLAPNAQQAALSIQNLLPQFKGLQIATQDAFFSGLGEEIHRLTTEYLPSIKTLTTSIAGSFNEMLKGIGDQLMTPGTQSAMQSMMADIATAFREVAPAARSFAQAFIDLSSVGASFLPDLARGAADAARAFAEFIREAKNSGELRSFIEDGINAVGALGQALWDLGGIIYKVFGSDGKKNVEDFRDTMEGVNTVIATLGGDFSFIGADIQEEFGKMTGVAAVFRDAVLDIPEAFVVMGNAIIGTLNFVKNALDTLLLEPLRKLAGLLNNLAGTLGWAADIPVIGQIPDIPNLPPSWGGDWSGYTTPPQGGPAGPGRYRTRYGQDIPIPEPGRPRFGSPYPGPFSVPSPPPAEAGGGGGGGGTTSKFTGPMGTEPQFVDINKIAESFGLVMTSGMRPGDTGSFHSAGEAGDFGMPGGGRNTDQMLAFATFMRENFGSQLDELIYHDPRFSGMQVDSGKAVADAFFAAAGDHTDHVHIAVRDALQAEGYVPESLGTYSEKTGPKKTGPTPVEVIEFGGSAKSDLQGIFAPMAEDFGISGGLPGVMKWLTTFLGNLAFAGAIRGGAFGDPAALLGATGGAQSQPGMFTSPSAMGPAELQVSPSPQWSADWNAIADKESGGNWGINTGNGYQGGLQFAPSSWNQAGGQQYAPAAHLATPFQQAMTAENLLRQQGPGAWPNTFTPGSTGPMPPGGGGVPGGGYGITGGPGLSGGPGFNAGVGRGGPGIGAAAGQGAQQAQGYVPGSGGWQPGAPSGGGGGGLAGQAAVAAASMFPGGGAAAQVAAQLTSRAIEYGGQLAAIGTSGLMETFLPAGSALGDPSKSWLGKMAAGFGGARPAQKSTAGKSEPAMKDVDPRGTKHGEGKGQPPGPQGDTYNINGSDPQAIQREIARQKGSEMMQMQSHGSGMGW